MNLLIPHSWLKEYLQTTASPQKIAECLSLCSCSVEKIEQQATDSIYHIEITTNRVDMMSVLGIAREATAILPQFGIKAKLINNPYKTSLKSKFKSSKSSPKLKVIIKDQKLCPRFTAVILKNTTIKPSPKLIQERLKKSGIRPINNIVDLSNYLMRAFGQPVHTFDYDKIAKKTMILRPSREGEKIITLDKKTLELPGGDIVIEDGSKRLIDLCGIMGGLNSAIDPKTKNILLFIQTYRPENIRKTSMALAQRTEAAQLFEKNTDPELVMPTIIEGIKLAEKISSAQPDKQIIDIYPKPYKPETIKVSTDLINKRLGIAISISKIKNILESLNFVIKQSANSNPSTSLRTGQQLIISPPSFRSHDIKIPEDIVEEVARIYGYYKLPSILPPLLDQPQKSKINFHWENTIKHMLKDWGLTEVYTYSFVSKELIEKFGLDPKEHLKLKNPLVKDWEYMRTCLIPSLLQVISDNQNTEKNLSIFEIANDYFPVKNDLPLEKSYLVIAFSGERFFELKGLAESLLGELKIAYEFKKYKDSKKRLNPQKTVDIYSDKNKLGFLGQLNPQLASKFNYKNQVYIAALNSLLLTTLATNKKTYHPIPKYPPIIEDLTFEYKKPLLYSEAVGLIRRTSSLVVKVELTSQYQNKKTFRIHYQDPNRSLTDKEISKTRKEVVKNLEFNGLKLVGKLD